MKKVDLNTIDGLNKLKENLSQVIDNKIKDKQLQEKVNSFDKLSFGELKNIFEGVCHTIFEKDKKNIAKYVNVIKENRDLRILNNLYESILKPKYVSNPDLFVKSLITISEGLDKKNIKRGNSDLCKIVKESVLNSGINCEEIDELINTKKDLNNSIGYIFENNLSVKNAIEHTNNLNNVIKYITENCKSEECKTKTNKELIDDLNENIIGLESWESELIKEVSLCNLSESSQSDLFNKYKKDCLDLLEEIIDKCDNIEMKSKFESMKNSMNEKKYDESKFKTDILNIAELKQVLKGETK